MECCGVGSIGEGKAYGDEKEGEGLRRSASSDAKSAAKRRYLHYTGYLELSKRLESESNSQMRQN